MSFYNSDQNLWMQKYRYTLQRLEQEEKQWRKKEGLLKLISTWLILAADPSDQQLNNDLQELRLLLRNSQDSSSLQAMAERLGVSVTRLNKERKKKLEGGEFIDLFISVLDSLGTETQTLPEKQTLVEALTGAQRRAGQSGLVETCAEIVHKYLQFRNATDQPRQDDVAEAQVAAHAISESAPKLHEAFTQLIHRLEFPHHIYAQACIIIDRMSEGISVDQVNRYINEIVDLVLQARLLVQAEKKDMERFLESLSDQLNDIDEYLTMQKVSERQTKEMRGKLNGTVGGEVRMIETVLQEATDLETIKSTIQSRLDAIHAHLAEQSRVEAEGFRKTEAEIQVLQTRLKATEDVTAELREKLILEREQAMRDPLTGLYNRIAYEERIHHEVKRFERHGSPLSLIVLDIDHFKQVNDSYGHKTGDRLLRYLAEVLQDKIRDTDMLVRFGGEEFVILASDTDAQNALILGEKLRQTIHRCHFHFVDKRIPISISCGISSLKTGDNAASLFERADKALYKAKASGRNLCTAA